MINLNRQWKSHVSHAFVIELSYLCKLLKLLIISTNFQFEDGYLDFIVMREWSKLALISLISKLNSGGHVKSPYVVYIKVSAPFIH